MAMMASKGSAREKPNCLKELAILLYEQGDVRVGGFKRCVLVRGNGWPASWGWGGGGRGLVLHDAARGIIPLTGKGEFITARNILDEDI